MSASEFITGAGDIPESKDAGTPQPQQYDNPEHAAHVREATKERRQDKQQAASEAKRAAQKISDRQEDKEIHLRVNGSRVPFHVLGGALNDIEDTIFDLRGKDEEDMTDAEAEQEREAMDKLDWILDEKCKWADPDTKERPSDDFGIFTYRWWRDRFDREERQEFIGDLHGGGIEGSDADGFRSK